MQLGLGLGTGNGYFIVYPCHKSDKHLCFALMAWGLFSGCVCESVGVAQEARDHSYFRIPSVVNKVHPIRNVAKKRQTQ